MPYMFSKIDSLLQRKSDALQPQASAGGQQQEQTPQQGGTLQLAKPSTEVSGGQSSGGNRAEAGQTADQYTKTNFQSAQGIIEANKGAGAGSLTQGAAGSIAKAQGDLQAAANKYTTDNTFKAQYDQNDLTKATGGDEQSFGKIRSLLNDARPAPQDFSYAGKDNKATEDKVKALQTTEGLQTELKSRNNDYTNGGARLDAALTRGSAGARQQLGGLVTDYAAYDDATRQATADAAKVKEKFGTDWEAGRGQLRTDLDKMDDEIMAGVGSRLPTAQAEADRLDGAYRESATGRAGDIRREMAKQMAGHGDGPLFEEYMRVLSGTDASPFIRATSGKLQEENVISTDEAGRFNKINELLGNPTRKSRYDPVAPMHSFKEDDYRRALESGLTPEARAQIAQRVSQANPNPAPPAPPPEPGVLERAGDWVGETGNKILEKGAEAVDDPGVQTIATGGWNNVPDMARQARAAAKDPVQAMRDYLARQTKPAEDWQARRTSGGTTGELPKQTPDQSLADKVAAQTPSVSAAAVLAPGAQQTYAKLKELFGGNNTGVGADPSQSQRWQDDEADRLAENARVLAAENSRVEAERRAAVEEWERKQAASGTPVNDIARSIVKKRLF